MSYLPFLPAANDSPISVLSWKWSSWPMHQPRYHTTTEQANCICKYHCATTVNAAQWSLCAVMCDKMRKE